MTTFLVPLFLAILGAVVMVVFLLNLVGFSAAPSLETAGFFALGMAFRITCNSLSFEASFMSASRCRSSQ